MAISTLGSCPTVCKASVPLLSHPVLMKKVTAITLESKYIHLIEKIQFSNMEY
jgi:hypothetical protein